MNNVFWSCIHSAKARAFLKNGRPRSKNQELDVASRYAGDSSVDVKKIPPPRLSACLMNPAELMPLSLRPPSS